MATTKLRFSGWPGGDGLTATLASVGGTGTPAANYTIDAIGTRVYEITITEDLVGKFEFIAGAGGSIATGVVTLVDEAITIDTTLPLESIQDAIDGISTQISASLSTSTERLSAVSADGGTISIIQGDDYTGTDISWTSTVDNQWELTGKTLKFGLQYGDTTLEVDATINQATGTQLVSVQLTSAQTGALPFTSVGKFDLQTFDASEGTYKTIIRGKVKVLESFTSPPA
ncbi:hypothetical protein [Rhodopirellula halodulae]|uniref:hypothetical protein n=1 Tax=Rhodopirellula halodulae TaxID=2894198 RepID=UPI001E3EEAD2|nr:hypothetical protein [Rhodopirellula sp. JC737]MCC9655301.1 hypothetical protein [Rhodopirellula sp. JC737]